MARRSLFVGVAVAILVVACAVAVRWTAAAALDLFAPASSGKALLLARDGAERFIDIAVKTFAVRPSIAAAAPIPTGMTKLIGVATTPLAAAPGGSAFATLYVSAAVVISGTETGAAHITTRLWMRGDAATPGPLYATPKGVEVGQLDAAPAGHSRRGQQWLDPGRDRRLSRRQRGRRQSRASLAGSGVQLPIHLCRLPHAACGDGVLVDAVVHLHGTAEALRAICDLDLSERQATVPPRGFGRD